MSCPYRYAMNVSVVRASTYPQIQFIITLIIISFSSGFDCLLFTGVCHAPVLIIKEAIADCPALRLVCVTLR